MGESGNISCGQDDQRGKIDAAADHVNSHFYLALPRLRTPAAFRVLLLHPGTSDKELECTITLTSLADRPKFERQHFVTIETGNRRENFMQRQGRLSRAAVFPRVDSRKPMEQNLLTSAATDS